MRRTLHDVLADYEVIGQPIVGPRRLTYVPWVERAVEPYEVTRLPNCTIVGLWDALRRAGTHSTAVASAADTRAPAADADAA